MKDYVKEIESALKGAVEEYAALEERNGIQWLLLHQIGKCTNIKQVRALLDEHYRL
ncbi:MAG: hypothetical protein MJH10_16740 [Epibacterium sp.]|nr:hypothetical protein [Epibacterium sp.]NQX75157.1 hypothetical protein [Epibacterium sp.]